MRIFSFLLFFISFFGQSQNFEISPNFYDSLSIDSFEMHLNGYATFNDSMVFYVSIEDTNSTIVYSANKDFTTSGTSSLINFQYDPVEEDFSFDLGLFTHHVFRIRLWVEINGELKEELLIDTY